jgi:hypothetical protein
VLSPVALPVENDNARIGSTDPWTDPQRIAWSPSSRTLAMDGTSTLTLTGQNYVLCSLVLSNSARIIVPDDGTPVRIYIDSPQSCGGDNLSFSLRNSATIENVSGDPRMVQLYVAGSDSSPTYVEFHNLHELTMVVYAPNSNVSFNNNNTFTGAIAARKVDMQNNLEIRWDARLSSLYSGDVPLPVYSRQAWVECTLGETGSEPDAGC